MSESIYVIMVNTDVRVPINPFVIMKPCTIVDIKGVPEGYFVARMTPKTGKLRAIKIGQKLPTNQVLVLAHKQPEAGIVVTFK